MDRIDIQIRAPHVHIVHTLCSCHPILSTWHHPISQDLVVSVCGCRDRLPLPPDDEEEDAGGDAEDDGEHGDHGGQDDVVQHGGGGGSAVARHLRQDWRKWE